MLDEVAAVALGIAFPCVFFILAAAGALEEETAFTVAKWSGLGLIGFYGFCAGRLTGASVAASLLQALVVGTIGGVLIGDQGAGPLMDAPARPYGEDTHWQPAPLRLGLLRTLVAWVVGAVAVWIAAAVVPGVGLEQSGAAFLVAALVAVLNALLPPVLAALRLPFMLVTGFLLVLVADAGSADGRASDCCPTTSASTRSATRCWRRW